MHGAGGDRVALGLRPVDPSGGQRHQLQLRGDVGRERQREHDPVLHPHPLTEAGERGAVGEEDAEEGRRRRPVRRQVRTPPPSPAAPPRPAFRTPSTPAQRTWRVSAASRRRRGRRGRAARVENLWMTRANAVEIPRTKENSSLESAPAGAQTRNAGHLRADLRLFPPASVVESSLARHTSDPHSKASHDT